MSCAQTGSEYYLERRLQLFPASGPHEFAAMDILGTLLKARQNSQFIVVMKSCYSKLTRPVPTSRMSSVHMADIFPDKRIIPFSTTKFVLADNSPPFVSKFIVCNVMCRPWIHAPNGHHSSSANQRQRQEIK